MFLTKSKPNPGQTEKTAKEENYVSLQIPEYWREVFRKRLEDIISETSCQKSPARGNTQLENTTKQGTQNSQLNDIILGSGEPCLALSVLVDIGIAYPPFPQEMFPLQCPCHYHFHLVNHQQKLCFQSARYAVLFLFDPVEVGAMWNSGVCSLLPPNPLMSLLGKLKATIFCSPEEAFLDFPESRALNQLLCTFQKIGVC